MLSWALVLGLAALFAGLGVQAAQRADALEALTPEQRATAEIEPAGSFEHSLRSASTTTSPIELLIQPPLLTLKLFWSYGDCMKIGQIELDLVVFGGVPPYTLTIDGQSIDAEAGEGAVAWGGAVVTCGSSTADPAPGAERIIRSRVTDSRGVTAQDELRLALTAPPPRARRGAIAHDASTEAALRLSWTTVSAVPSVSAYELRYQATAWDAADWPDAWTAIGDAIAGSATQYVHRNLDSNRRYRYQLRARNGVNAGEWSRTFPAVGLRPGAPLLEARTAASGSVALSWSAGPAAATSWEYRRKPADGSWGAWTAIAQADASSAAHTVAGLTEDARYHFQLRAHTASGAGSASATAIAVAGMTPSEGRSLNYRDLDSTGGAARPRSYVFLKDADDLTSGAATFAEVSSAEALLLNTQGYAGYAYSDYADFLSTVQVGDRFTWHLYGDCWYHYRVTAILADPPPPARKLFRIALVTEDPCGVAAARDGNAKSYFNESRDIYATFSWNLPPPNEPRIGADGIRIFPLGYPVEGGHTYRLSDYGARSRVVIDVPAGLRLTYTGGGLNSDGTTQIDLKDETSGAELFITFGTGEEMGRNIPAERGSSAETRDVGALFDAIVASARVQPWR